MQSSTLAGDEKPGSELTKITEKIDITQKRGEGTGKMRSPARAKDTWRSVHVGISASKLPDEKTRKLGDWREKTLVKVRQLIMESIRKLSKK